MLFDVVLDSCYAYSGCISLVNVLSNSIRSVEEKERGKTNKRIIESRLAEVNHQRHRRTLLKHFEMRVAHYVLDEIGR